ncbi:hypothetical protein DL98DRAFT_575775 [Cadophora sp. DSE1049]|nr:hypothetical protein DL98DRAFT_575775 [Cadophora sp. DSE1049]
MPLLNNLASTLTSKLPDKLTDALLKPSGITTNNNATASPSYHASASGHGSGSISGSGGNKKENITSQLLAAAKPVVIEMLSGKVEGKESTTNHRVSGYPGSGGHGGYTGHGGGHGVGGECAGGHGGGGGSNAEYYGYVNRDPHGLKGRRVEEKCKSTSNSGVDAKRDINSNSTNQSTQHFLLIKKSSFVTITASIQSKAKIDTKTKVKDGKHRQMIRTNAEHEPLLKNAKIMDYGSQTLNKKERPTVKGETERKSVSKTNATGLVTSKSTNRRSEEKLRIDGKKSQARKKDKSDVGAEVFDSIRLPFS